MANIIVHRRKEPVTGGIWFEYEWDGAENEPVYISRAFLESHPESNLPWTLELLDQNPYLSELAYVRTDTAFPWYAWHRLKAAWRKMQWVKVRLIATLVIWGIGHIEPGQVIDWHCLKQQRR